MHRIIFQRDDSSSYAAAGRDLISCLQLPEHRLPLLLTALLRHDENKIEDRKNKDERGNPDPTGRAAGL